MGLGSAAGRVPDVGLGSAAGRVPDVGLGPQGGDRRRPGSAPLRFDLSTCVSRYGPPPAAVDALRNLSVDVLRRHPYGAEDHLAGAYARFLGVSADEVVVGRGASDLIWRLAASPLAARVAVPLPAYTEYRQAFPGAGVGHGGPHHDLGLVAELLAAGRVVLLSNPHNPSGRALPPAELAAAAAAGPAGALVVDESYVEFAPDPAAVTLVGPRSAAAGNVVVLRSPSKFFGLAGARVGVAWSPSAWLRAAFGSARGSWPVSALEVLPAMAALADEAWAAGSHAALQEDAAWLEDAVGVLGRPVSGALTHFRLVPVDDAVAMARRLEAIGLGVRVLGGAHGLAGPALRLAAPRAEERAEVAAVLRAAAPAGRGA